MQRENSSRPKHAEFHLQKNFTKLTASSRKDIATGAPALMKQLCAGIYTNVFVIVNEFFRRYPAYGDRAIKNRNEAPSSILALDHAFMSFHFAKLDHWISLAVREEKRNFFFRWHPRELHPERASVLSFVCLCSEIGVQPISSRQNPSSGGKTDNTHDR
jgi:hypothetical protein